MSFDIYSKKGPTLTYGPACHRDLERIWAVTEEYLPDGLGIPAERLTSTLRAIPQRWMNGWDENKLRIITVKAGDELAGMILYSLYADSPDSCLELLLVTQPYQGLGLSRQLVRYYSGVLQKNNHPRFLLTVTDANTQAANVYGRWAKQGLLSRESTYTDPLLGERTNYYGNVMAWQGDFVPQILRPSLYAPKKTSEAPSI
ncbi:MAG TPA: GNAT family N-acetyltransferase [Alphaproteobacteria bacterium]|nr:GNAT family N-acetyltransferase [Alphaproteobacteria bacterium]